MLEVVEEDPVSSLNPAEEVRPLGEAPEPQEEWPTAIHAPDHPEEALEPEGASSLGVMAITCRQLPLTPPGFSELLAGKSGPPHLEDADSPIGVPQGAQLDLSSLGSMQVVITHNILMMEL